MHQLYFQLTYAILQGVKHGDCLGGRRHGTLFKTRQDGIPVILLLEIVGEVGTGNPCDTVAVIIDLSRIGETLQVVDVGNGGGLRLRNKLLAIPTHNSCTIGKMVGSGEVIPSRLSF